MSRTFRRRSAAVAAVGVTAAGALAIAGAPASAHVTVQPGEATQGGFARVDFRVPTESDTESTTGVEVHFPEDAPVPSVSVKPVPGWTAEVSYRTLDEPIEGGHGEQITEVVESITWTADDADAAIDPGEFGEFPVSMGPMPEADELHFRALQTYSDEEVVRWIELPAGDGDEPDFPAPALQLAPAGAGDDVADAQDTEASAGEDGGSSGDSDAAAGSDDSGGGAAVWLGLAGLVAGLAGLTLGGLAFQRARG